MNAERGFTILEMLVALAVLSLGAMALLNLSGENTRTAALLHSRLFAGIVADNRAVEAVTSIAPPSIGTETGTELSGGRSWRWTRIVAPSSHSGVLRISVTVMSPEGGRAAAQAVLFRVTR
ncbi:MAG TPA: type II secretion system minor pseudopilin GspI [Rhizomicrobium sp.]|nr:type II secretion system minor pseudopilin GspI [Rhizomicrobium sp.]